MWAAFKWKQCNLLKILQRGKIEIWRTSLCLEYLKLSKNQEALEAAKRQSTEGLPIIHRKFLRSCLSLPLSSKKVLISLVIWLPCPSNWGEKWNRKGSRGTKGRYTNNAQQVSLSEKKMGGGEGEGVRTTFKTTASLQPFSKGKQRCLCPVKLKKRARHKKKHIQYVLWHPY